MRRVNTYSVPEIKDSKGNSVCSHVTSENLTITSILSMGTSEATTIENGRPWADDDWMVASAKNAEVKLEMYELEDPPLIPELLSSEFSHMCDPGTSSLDSVSDLKRMFELDNRWKLILLGRIGQGFYGEVFKASLEQIESNEEPQTVAVKRLRAEKLGEGSQDFFREINIMKRLRHANIVQIKAVIRDPELNLVMEFLHHGSLQCYLKINKDRLRPLGPNHLLKFALDIAMGMIYLGEKKIVHRDLAARNVLVANESQVKISDFGLARVVDPNSEYYVLKTNRHIPIKWYAPELLHTRVNERFKFSASSDMWSYGVTLFEVFSFGEDPQLPTLKEHSLDQTLLLAELEKNVRLPIPRDCPQDIYTSLISPCWRLHPHERHTFSQAAQIIEQLRETYCAAP